ncbi:hypothetical protein JCM9279_002963 [Rhodotorula babjevae]
MRSAGLLHGARPRRAPASRPLQRSPGYSTLAPPRPSLVRPRPALSPSLLLVHIGTISFATCFIPVIGARAASTRATADAEQAAEDDRGPLALAQPLQRPNPPNLQLFRLAAQLRRQIPASPQDASFTLRQLHLVNQEPKLFLPEPPTSSSTSSRSTPLIFPETWVWRLPAAAALHAILRLLAAPTPSPAADALLPIALRITQHALQFDTVMWGAVLRSRDERAAERWDERVERDRAAAEVEGGTQSRAPMPRVALAKRPRERSASPSVEAWSREVAAAPAEPISAAVAAEPAARTLRPPASLPARSLDRLFLHLARNGAHASSALSISLALSRLRRRRTPDALSRSIDLALHTKQLDVAAQFCADWLEQLDDSIKSSTTLVRALRRLSKQLRDGQGHFATVPSLPALGAIAHLARALDDSWARLPGDQPAPGSKAAARAERSGEIGALVHLLVKVPDAPSPLLFKRGSTRRRHARAHVAAARMAREALRRVLEDVVGRELVLDSSSSASPDAFEVSLGAQLSPENTRRALALGLFDFNALLAYALHRLESPEVALAVLERMTELGLKPSAATENVLFGAFDGGEERGVERALRRAQEHDERGSGSVRTAPTLVSHVARTASNDEIERLVFRFLPELDLSPPTSGAASSSPGDATSRLLLAHRDGASRPPPSTGRSPYLYTTLLHALACAGRTGLAERVFRNARWAAELSRSDGRKGWVVPPHAFTSMLWLYAAEVKRGRALERRGEGAEEGAAGAYVRGWGRHALRVFLLRESRAHLAAQLGPSHESSPSSSLGTSSLSLSASSNGGRPRRHDPFRALPSHVLRSEAAPLVAIYELEGGSRADEERASLAEAMRAPHSREALRVLFPEEDARRREEEEGEGGQARKLSEMGQRTWKRGERATMRRRPQWDRARPGKREVRAHAEKDE